MRHFIAKSESGDVVGKWVFSSEPTIPDELELIEADDVSNYNLDRLY